MNTVYDSTTSVLRSDYRTEKEYRQALRDAMQHYGYCAKVFGGWKFFEFVTDLKTWKAQK